DTAADNSVSEQGVAADNFDAAGSGTHFAEADSGFGDNNSAVGIVDYSIDLVRLKMELKECREVTLNDALRIVIRDAIVVAGFLRFNVKP
nr:hypothetical protein [Tanacetum cinerariifolium]